MNLESLWNKVLEGLSYSMNMTSYNQWILELKPIGIKDGCLYIAAKNELVYKTVDMLYLKIIEDLVKDATDDNIPVKLIVGSGDDIIAEEQKTAPLLNPKYTFDTFVVGTSNNFAHAAARAICDFFPNTAQYNPFFLHGGVGLGKTHLMHAIGNEIYRKFPDKKILYVSSETFTNEVISAIRPSMNDEATTRSAALRKKYRDVDVFMIDDIEFVAGKTSTESEFFHTFNQLYLDGKQIIISADRPPRELPILNDRMVTRFSSGIVADIQTPEFETRVAILKNHAERAGISISNELLSRIAEKIESNIRELEGAFNTIVAQSQLTGCKISNTLVDRVIKDWIYSREKNKITAEMIIQAVSDYYDIPVSAITGKKRDKNIALARQLAMYLCRELLVELPYKDIGKEFGGKHYSTVIHAYETISERLKSSPGSELHVAVDDIKSKLKNI